MQNRRFKKLAELFAMLVAVLMLTSAFTVSKADSAEASTAGFDAGYIISDALFYDGNAMTASQVQAFLDKNINDGKCTINDPRFPARKAGAAWGSHYKINTHCLNNLKVNAVDKPADAYCKAYTAKRNSSTNKIEPETSAEIITKVGKACGISPKVLLVMLQKEQSLVTDSWPTTRQIQVAMGFNCPDTGPGGTANCAPASFGFFNQVYSAARQYIVYKKSPAFSYFPAGKPVSIGYAPAEWGNCGSKTVTIANDATAGLYYYTPYTPNAAALRGDFSTSCALGGAGNTNFFKLYKSWFGTPNAKFTVHNTMLNYWNENRESLGEPVANAIAGGGGYSQRFTNGMLFSNSKGEVLLVDSRFASVWNKAGAAANPSGVPLGAAKAIAGGHTLDLSKGVMYRSASGTFTLQNGTILTEYKSSGGPGGAWGWPVTDLFCDKSGNECLAEFQNGVAVWTKVKGLQFSPQKTISKPAEDPNASKNLLGGTV